LRFSPRIDELDYNAITVGFPVLAFGSILVAMGANYSPLPNTPQLAEGSFMPGGWPRDWTKLDSLQVLTKWLNVMPKVADTQPSDRGVRKG
jgi:hypothetical protein